MTLRSGAVSPTEFENSLDTNDDEKIVRGDELAEKANLDQEAKECEHPEELTCRECEDQEVEHIKTVRSPTEPSKAEREEHNLHHCNYRSWCDACVRGQAKDDAHGLITGEMADS